MSVCVCVFGVSMEGGLLWKPLSKMMCRLFLLLNQLNSIQIKFICIALFTIQIIAKQLYRTF